MEESMMVSKHNEQMQGSTTDANVRQPSINTEPRTLDEAKMERVRVTAQRVFASHPSEDFTKDAVDTATKENVPAEDATDDLVGAGFKTPVPTESPAAPPPSPAT